MASRNGLALPVTALVIYVIGGVGIFGGIALIAFMKERDLFGLGDGRSLGFLSLCIGVCMSLLGVFLMRIFRNRRW
jgi:hypothetical protein